MMRMEMIADKTSEEISKVDEDTECFNFVNARTHAYMHAYVHTDLGGLSQNQGLH